MEDINRSVTSVIVQRPLKAHVSAYEAWLREIIPVAMNYPGHRGVNVIRPHGHERDYTIVLHFDTEPSLRSWLESEERTILINKVRPLLDTDESIEILTGLEYWFTPQGRHAPLPYKQFLVTLSAIFPLTLIVPSLLLPWLQELPQILRTLVIDSTIVGLMAFVIMPRYVKLISNWLFRR